MLLQFRYFLEDYKRAVGRLWFRGLYIWLSFSIIGIFFYRIDRGLFLLFGNSYRIIRVLLLPLFSLISALSNLDIHYRASIGGGLVVLHNSPGIVISGNVVIGRNLTLTGGNVIGVKGRGRYVIGDNCYLGANAVVLGPIVLGDNVTVGACACVVKDCPSNVIVCGVPGRILNFPNPD